MVKGEGGGRGGVMVRAFVFHQCGPGLNPGLGVICGRACCFYDVTAGEAAGQLNHHVK